jgi:hypothetical protein
VSAPDVPLIGGMRGLPIYARPQLAIPGVAS